MNIFAAINAISLMLVPSIKNSYKESDENVIKHSNNSLCSGYYSYTAEKGQQLIDEYALISNNGCLEMDNSILEGKIYLNSNSYFTLGILFNEEEYLKILNEKSKKEFLIETDSDFETKTINENINLLERKEFDYEGKLITHISYSNSMILLTFKTEKSLFAQWI